MAENSDDVVRGAKVMLMRDNEYLMTNRRFPRLTEKAPTKKLAELVKIVEKA